VSVVVAAFVTNVSKGFMFASFLFIYMQESWQGETPEFYFPSRFSLSSSSSSSASFSHSLTHSSSLFASPLAKSLDFFR